MPRQPHPRLLKVFTLYAMLSFCINVAAGTSASAANSKDDASAQQKVAVKTSNDVDLNAIAKKQNPVVKITIVPAGNINKKQPDVPGASSRRTRAKKTTFDKKYEKIIALLQSDKKLKQKIIKAAQAYNIDPRHIAGALIGEHTYNVDVLDRFQTYYVKARSYSEKDFHFHHEGERVTTFLQREQFDACDEEEESISLWTCRENVWDTQFRGKQVDGKSWPENRFSAVFFQPFLAGQTFGLGQVNPLTALKMSDLVHTTSKGKRIKITRASELYREIMRPDSSLHYVAAILKTAIDDYKNIAGFDISGNPGLTATLYNLGSSRSRAQALAKGNEARRAKGKKPKLPEENYYGWLINDRIADLDKIYEVNANK